MIFNYLKHKHSIQVSSLGLGVFRIVYGLILEAEVSRIFYFKRLIFDIVPYMELHETGLASWLLILWMLIIGAIILGFRTSEALLLNYVFGLFTFSSFTAFEYHVFYLYTHLNFLLLFLPVQHVCSLDRWLNREKVQNREISPKVSILYYKVPVFTGLGLLYLDSFFYKLNSSMWLNGWGVWLPSSLPMMVYEDWTFWLNQYYLFLFLGYFIPIFEFFFIFLMGFRRLRWPLWAAGVILHGGIFGVYPIPFFSLTMLALYILFMPPAVWDYLETLFKKYFLKMPSKQTQEDWVEDEKPMFALSRWKFYKIHLLYCWVCYACLAQALWLYQNLAYPHLHKNSALAPVLEKVQSPLNQLNYFNQFFLGIRAHALFEDSHFESYNHIIAPVYHQGKKEIWLPLHNQAGQAVGYNQGFIWANWTFRVNTPSLNRNSLKQGLKKYTAFWAFKQGISLNQAEFTIKLKTLDKTPGWQKDYLKKQMRKPWKNIGKVIWTKQHCEIILPDSLEGF